MMALLIAEKACTLVILYKSRDQSGQLLFCHLLYY